MRSITQKFSWTSSGSNQGSSPGQVLSISVTCSFQRQSMSLSIFHIIGQITSAGNTELWFLSFWGTCLEREGQQSCLSFPKLLHSTRYCIKVWGNGSPHLSVQDTFENTIHDAMNPFRKKKKYTCIQNSVFQGSQIFP